MTKVAEKRVLIVDDDATVRQVLAKILVNAGYRVEEAADGEQAATALEASEPDLILCDITMPGEDGMDLLRDVKRDRRLGRIPFIFLTASTELDSIMSGIREGAADYITKPFRPDRVLEAVERALGK
jgi:CheY-like chemotaxis protein